MYSTDAGQAFRFQGKRVFPAYLQAGPSFFIAKSRRRMIAEDLSAALHLVSLGVDRYLILTWDGKVIADQVGQAVGLLGPYLQVRVEHAYQLVDIHGRLVARYGEGEAVDSKGQTLLVTVVDNRIAAYLPD